MPLPVLIAGHDLCGTVFIPQHELCDEKRLTIAERTFAPDTILIVPAVAQHNSYAIGTVTEFR